MIGFVTRACIWGFLGLLILPSVVPHDTAPPAASNDVDATETTFHAVRVASAIASDMGSLCERQPAICDSGQRLAEAAALRARHGLSVASQMISGPPQDAAVPDEGGPQN